MKTLLRLCAVLTLLCMLPVQVRAEVDQVSIAQQYGVAFLPLMLLEHDKLVEKYAKINGLGDIKVSYATVSGPNVLNDGLLSGQINFAAVGAPSLITLWSKTKGIVDVKGVSSMTTYPLYMNVRNPAVKSIRDFTDKDKIAVPAVKVSTQAIVLQMAAAKAFGQENWARLDPLTVSLGHPDGLLALKSGSVDAHFTTSPFHEEELKMPGVRTIFTSYDVLGGPATAALLITTSKFREANPRVYKSFLAALTEAIQTINKDKRAAAALYVQLNKGTTETPEQVYAMISAPNYAYTLVPQKVYATAEFMARIGSVPQKPNSWKDLFFPEIGNLPGN